MLADSYIVPECIARPGSFGGLMALYEANFIKLDRLTGDLETLDGEFLSISRYDCDLYLCTQERSRYTSDLRLTYLFADHAGLMAQPDLSLRVYLDARMVDVQTWATCQRHEFLRELARRFPRELDRRWASSIMLGKWLDYLLEKDHQFRSVIQAAIPQEA